MKTKLHAFVCTALLGFGAIMPAHADQSLEGNVTVTGGSTGNLFVTGAVDIDGNSVTFGTQGATYGAGLIYTDSPVDTLNFLLNRTTSSWLWQHTTVAAMRLDSGHKLSLYKADGTTVGVSLDPVTSTLSLGSAALYRDSNGALKTNGAFVVGGNFTAPSYTATNGTLTGGTTGLILNAGGTNQNITLTPSGTGYVILNGNVGIGTTSPTGRLDVRGGMLFVSDSTAGPGAFVQGHANVAYFGAVDGRRASFGNQENWETLTVDDGKVGIGTTGPGAKFEVVGETRIDGSGANAAFFSTISDNLGANGTTFETTYYGSGGYGPLKIRTGGAERLRIAASGNVGIGTSAPAALLHVSGNNSTRVLLDNGVILSQKNVSGSISNLLTHYSDDNVYLDNPDGRIFLRTTTTGLLVDSTGNVGIGTTGPGAKFEVVGETRIDGSGANAAFFSTISDNLGANGTTFETTYYGSGGYGPLKIRTGGAERLRIAASGNVGIGTESPTHKLSVKGTIRAQEVIVDNTNWADYVFEEDYRLAPLAEVEQHIKTEKHLPGIPSAAEVAEHGVSMGDMQAKLLSKIEELTLHLIAQEKEIAALRQQVGELKAASAD